VDAPDLPCTALHESSGCHQCLQGTHKTCPTPQTHKSESQGDEGGPRTRETRHETCTIGPSTAHKVCLGVAKTDGQDRKHTTGNTTKDNRNSQDMVYLGLFKDKSQCIGAVASQSESEGRRRMTGRGWRGVVWGLVVKAEQSIYQ